MPLVIQRLDETAEDAILRYLMEHPDEEEAEDYFIVRLVAPGQVLAPAY